MRANKDKLLPDHLTYSEWFDSASEQRRRLAVGTRRYSAIADIVDNPSWEHFVNPETGELLTVDELTKENARQRNARLATLRGEIADQAKAVEKVAVFGVG